MASKKIATKRNYKLCIYLKGTWFSWYSSHNPQEFIPFDVWQGLDPIAVISRPVMGLQKTFDLEYCRDTSPDMLHQLIGKSK